MIATQATLMKRPSRFRRSVFWASIAAAAASGYACSSDDQTSFGSPTNPGGAGSNQGASGAASTVLEGCGDLAACCLELSEQERDSCQDLAAAFASQANGDANCSIALVGYRKKGVCAPSDDPPPDDPPPDDPPPDDPPVGGAGGWASGSGGSGGSSAGTGGSGGKGGSSAGTGGSGGKGGSSAGTGGGGGKGGSSAGTGGTGGSGGKGGTGGSSAGTGGAGGSGTTTSEAAACEKWAQSVCGRFAACGSGELLSLFANESDCIDREAHDACPVHFFGPSSWTPAALGTCATDVAQLACTDLAQRTYPASCRPAPGFGANGASCFANGDCQSGLCDNNHEFFLENWGFLGGTCVQAIEDNQPCSSDTSSPGQCRSYRCNATKHTCTPRGQNPATCDSDDDCSIGYACDVNAAACRPLSAAGGPCGGSTGRKCSGLLGLVCDDTTHTCAPQKLPTAGKACQALDTCGGGSYCDATLFLGGTCQEQAEAGESCASTSIGAGLPGLQSSCHYPATCDSNKQKCVLPSF
jgi:hypothetical protein